MESTAGRPLRASDGSDGCSSPCWRRKNGAAEAPLGQASADTAPQPPEPSEDGFLRAYSRRGEGFPSDGPTRRNRQKWSGGTNKPPEEEKIAISGEETTFDTTVLPSSRIRAAEILLIHTLRGYEITSVSDRLQALELHLGTNYGSV
jgi:hypothetical protein